MKREITFWIAVQITRLSLVVVVVTAASCTNRSPSMDQLASLEVDNISIVTKSAEKAARDFAAKINRLDQDLFAPLRHIYLTREPKKSSIASIGNFQYGIEEFTFIRVANVKRTFNEKHPFEAEVLVTHSTLIKRTEVKFPFGGSLQDYFTYSRGLPSPIKGFSYSNFTMKPNAPPQKCARQSVRQMPCLRMR